MGKGSFLTSLLSALKQPKQTEDQRIEGETTESNFPSLLLLTDAQSAKGVVRKLL